MAATIDVSRVSAFVAVAERSSFSAAARALGLPTSTVSRAVAALEAELGMRLLQRTTRHVSLTTDGAALYDKLAPAVHAITDALDAAGDGEEPSGLLRVTAAPDVGATLLAEAVTRFTARHPAVRVEVALTSRTVDLVAEGFDAAVRAATKPLKDSSLVARTLATLDVHVYASPAYVARHGMPRSADDAKQHAWVLFRGARAPGRRGAGERASRIVCDDFFFVRETVRAGGGLGLLPAFLARPYVDAGLLVKVLPGGARSGSRLVLLYPQGKQQPKRLTAFRDFLVESFAATGG